jgi:hypothetical protein
MNAHGQAIDLQAPTQRPAWRPGAAWLPACGFATLPLWVRADLSSAIALAGVAGAGLGSWWSDARRVARGAGMPAAADGTAEARAGMFSSLLCGLLPVWRQHLGSVRQQTDVKPSLVRAGDVILP